jgi:hypothetical protein
MSIPVQGMAGTSASSAAAAGVHARGGSGACRKITPESSRYGYFLNAADNPTTPSVPHKHRRVQPSPLPTSAPCLDWAKPAHDCARTGFAPAATRRPRQAVPSARDLGTQPSGRSHLGRAPPQASVHTCLLHAAKRAIPLGTSTGSFGPPAAPMAHFDQMSATVYPSGNGSEGSQTTSQYLRVPAQTWLG